MAVVFKCKMCGGNLEVKEGMTVCECEYCGSIQTVPQLDDEKKINLFSRANRLRSACEFDKASGVYESIVTEFPEEAEAYWGLILCKYGIEYVDDPKTGRKIPTCHRSSFDSVMDDPNFEMVMECSDPSSRAVYREEAKAIEELRVNIIEVSSKEEPYDIFICYKETDAMGERTIDSVIAQDVYDALTEKGYKVFFSRITLEDKLGQEYEPYIFAALNSAKVMLVFGTDYEYYNAVWVKNEWSRFLSLIEKGAKKTLIPCFKGIDAYDMPKEFARLQAQDMGKVGAIQDLVRGIGKIVNPSKTEIASDNPNTNDNNSTGALLKRVFIFLEDGFWDKANEYCEKVLDKDPENASAYLGKLMAELHIKTESDLANCDLQFDDKDNYRKVLRFGDSALADRLKGYSSAVGTRLENARSVKEQQENNSAYANATALMEKGNFKKAAAAFLKIATWKDAGQKAEECTKMLEDLEANRQENIEKLKTMPIKIEVLNSELKAIDKRLEELSGSQSDLQKNAHSEACQRIDQVVDAELAEHKKRIELLYAPQKEAVLAEMNHQVNSEEAEIQRVNSQIAELQKKISSLGLFKGKEKKVLQEQIDEFKNGLATRPALDNIKAKYQSQINEIERKEFLELSEIEAAIRKDHPYPSLSEFSVEDNPYKAEVTELEEKRIKTVAELDRLNSEINKLRAICSSLGAFGQGLNVKSIEDHVNGPHAFSSLKSIDELSLKLGKIYEKAFAGSEYDIDYLVEAKDLDEDADDDAYPVHFLFSKFGEPILAVVCCTSQGYRRPRVELTKNICAEKGIRYMRFFCDGGYPNKEDYVIKRTKEALQGRKITWTNSSMRNPQTGQLIQRSKHSNIF